MPGTRHQGPGRVPERGFQVEAVVPMAIGGRVMPLEAYIPAGDTHDAEGPRRDSCAQGHSWSMPTFTRRSRTGTATQTASHLIKVDSSFAKAAHMPITCQATVGVASSVGLSHH